MTEDGSSHPEGRVSSSHIWKVLIGLVLLGVAMASPGLTRRVPNLSVDAAREIGGAIIAGAAIGVVFLLWEEVLERRRDVRDRELADDQSYRDEWTAAMIQIASLGQRLADVDLRGRDLHGMLLPPSARVDRARFDGCNLRRAHLRGSELRDARFNGADLTSANLSLCNGHRVQFVEAQLQGADLSGSDFRGGVFTGASLEFADLSETSLGSAVLSGADLSAAVFQPGSPPTLGSIRIDELTKLPDWIEDGPRDGRPYTPTIYDTSRP